MIQKRHFFVFVWMILGLNISVLKVKHRGRYCGHQGSTLQVRAPGVCQSQFQPGGYGSHTVGEVHCGRAHGGGADGNGFALPPMT